MDDIWVIKVTYQKSSNDGISYYKNKSDLADAVYDAEQLGGRVQVYKCVPVDHECYIAKAAIEIYGDDDDDV